MKNLTFDVNRARSETSNCKDVIHFNNAGAALMPDRVIKSLMDYTLLEASLGGYEAAERESEQIEQMYSSASRLLNCNPIEVAFLESATRAWDMAFYSIPFDAGDVIITGMSEYESNYLAFMHISQKKGVKIEVIPNDECGQICVKSLQDRIHKRIKLIAITHIPTNGGLVNPVEEIGRIAQDAGIYYLLDSCQAAGQVPLDVRTIQCDFLSFTGRKYLRGPRGTGILYVKESVGRDLEPPFISLKSAEWVSENQYQWISNARKFEDWETHVGAKIGLGVAMEYALSWGVKEIQKRVVQIADLLRSRLSEIAHVRVLDLGKNQCGIVSFNVLGNDPNTVKMKLRGHQINISTSLKRSTRLDMSARGIESLCRASLHYYNSEEEVDRFCTLIERQFAAKFLT